MEIKIDVSDWHSEYMQEEPNLCTKEEAIQTRIRERYHPARIGRLYVVARERGDADPETLPANKLLLMTGAAAAWSRMEAAEIETVRLPSGKEIEVRSWVAPVKAADWEPPDDDAEQYELVLDDGDNGGKESPDDNPAPVHVTDPLASDRARRYLTERVPGYIYGRMKIIAAAGGDVWGVASELHDKIDELAARLA